MVVIIIAQPPPRRKNLGQRRVGSHGNPPIKLEPHLHGSQPQFTPRMKSSTSHPGEQHFLEPAHPNLHHSTSWETSAMAGGYRPPRTAGKNTVWSFSRLGNASLENLDMWLDMVECACCCAPIWGKNILILYICSYVFVILPADVLLLHGVMWESFAWEYKKVLRSWVFKNKQFILFYRLRWN